MSSGIEPIEEHAPKLKQLGLTDWTRMGLRMYHLSKDPEVGKKFKVIGKLTKDAEGFVNLPFRIHETLLQENLAPFFEGEVKIEIPLERNELCQKVLGKIKVKKPKGKLVSQLPPKSQRPQRKKKRKK